MVPRDRNRTAIPRLAKAFIRCCLNYTLGIRSDGWLCPFDLLLATMLGRDRGIVCWEAQ
jgi:hypothetical protein